MRSFHQEVDLRVNVRAYFELVKQARTELRKKRSMNAYKLLWQAKKHEAQITKILNETLD